MISISDIHKSYGEVEVLPILVSPADDPDHPSLAVKQRAAAVSGGRTSFKPSVSVALAAAARGSVVTLSTYARAAAPTRQTSPKLTHNRNMSFIGTSPYFFVGFFSASISFDDARRPTFITPKGRPAVNLSISGVKAFMIRMEKLTPSG